MWLHDVGVFHLSISCNHCEDPICVEVCPTGAMQKREDGLVLVNENQCIGCQYCAWACPYGAPQFHPAEGRITKCDFCVEEIEKGNPPVCVAACPMRALETVQLCGDASPRTADGTDSAAAPLPYSDLTRPNIAMLAHPAALKTDKKMVVNHDETGRRYHDDVPLKLITLLAPASVGLFVALTILYAFGITSSAAFAIPMALMMAGMAASLGHLGRPFLAWRALYRPQSSWLSREIWMASLTGAGMVLNFVLHAAGWPYITPFVRYTVIFLTSVCGVGLLLVLGRVYRLRTVPEWDTVWVQLGFFLTAAALGGLGSALVEVLDNPGSTTTAVLLAALAGGVALLAGGWVAGRIQKRLPGIEPSLKRSNSHIHQNPGWALRFAAAIAAALGAVSGSAPILASTFVAAFAAEWISRTMFYQARNE